MSRGLRRAGRAARARRSRSVREREQGVAGLDRGRRDRGRVAAAEIEIDERGLRRRPPRTRPRRWSCRSRPRTDQHDRAAPAIGRPGGHPVETAGRGERGAQAAGAEGRLEHPARTVCHGLGEIDGASGSEQEDPSRRPCGELDPQTVERRAALPVCDQERVGAVGRGFRQQRDVAELRGDLGELALESLVAPDQGERDDSVSHRGRPPAGRRSGAGATAPRPWRARAQREAAP